MSRFDDLEIEASALEALEAQLEDAMRVKITRARRR